MPDFCQMRLRRIFLFWCFCPERLKSRAQVKNRDYIRLGLGNALKAHSICHRKLAFFPSFPKKTSEFVFRVYFRTVFTFTLLSFRAFFIQNGRKISNGIFDCLKTGNCLRHFSRSVTAASLSINGTNKTRRNNRNFTQSWTCYLTRNSSLQKWCHFHNF